MKWFNIDISEVKLNEFLALTSKNRKKKKFYTAVSLQGNFKGQQSLWKSFNIIYYDNLNVFKKIWSMKDNSFALLKKILCSFNTKTLFLIMQTIKQWHIIHFYTYSLKFIILYCFLEVKKIKTKTKCTTKII